MPWGEEEDNDFLLPISSLVGRPLPLPDIVRHLLRWLQRDDLEAEADAISDYLLSPGPNGEPMAGIKDPLVDSEGKIDIMLSTHWTPFLPQWCLMV